MIKLAATMIPQHALYRVRQSKYIGRIKSWEGLSSVTMHDAEEIIEQLRMDG